jgi:hypothetical protein
MAEATSSNTGSYHIKGVLRKTSSEEDRDEDKYASEEDRDEDKYAIAEKCEKQKLVFTSPRFSARDEEIFRMDESLCNLEKRWDAISEQAGEHRQDGRVLIISRSLSTEALQKGMTKQASLRVRSLHLCLDQKEDNLPEWIDVISVVLVNLENLTISDAQDDEMAISKRMQRLYILYKMPKLKSIDDMPITSEEREIVRRKDCSDEGGNPDETHGGKRETVSVDSYDESMDGEGEFPRKIASESIGSNEAMQILTNNSAEALDEDSNFGNQNSNMEVDSAASSHHEWTAACGVLAFRSLPFCGTDTKAICDEDDLAVRAQAKRALQKKKETLLPVCPPVHRQSSRDSRSIVFEPEHKHVGTNSPAKFFPADNVKIEVTTKSAPRSPIRDQVVLEYRTKKAEKRRGESIEPISQPLPFVRMNGYKNMQQPNRNSTSAGGSKNLMNPLRLRKTRTRITSTSKENARTNSVFDDIYDDDEDGDELFGEEDSIRLP